eukprot:TRINITY_DN724_c0_g1_i6.p1 TRINITY_DN724_c0_g1~~TRINITY_DN724_c0_g1_i6.p1  ORF type:complete len:1692 (+),score=776.26 TRINITY_DN724_c0_g1_i6:128-5077(+)
MPPRTGADVAEDMQGDAEGRRNLQLNKAFGDLGEPIQKILVALADDGVETDEKTLQLLTHITVKQLAKVWEMLGSGEDPDTILAWLKRRARKNKKKSEPAVDQLKEKIRTGADRDPIAFFKELEAANQEKIREQQEMQEERDKLRQAKAKERERKREEQQKAMEDAKKAMAADGEKFNAAEALPENAFRAIQQAFEKFANDNSGFDNSNKDQDGEWWKKDQYRRDWERNKGKGKKWTAVIEGAKEPATEAELAVREEYYKSNDWWKADKYKKDWEATKDNEWWKEEPYIKDWEANKHEGARWRAADEESGLEGEAAQYPALPEELKRREAWYKANGPRGVVKRWNAATEGDVEKCSVPEKLEREEYYRNGDWWKGDGSRMAFKDDGIACPALKFAKAEDAQDKEWWKTEPYREDFFKNGPQGKKWNALKEAQGIDGTGDQHPAPDVEKKRREDWYKDNWWKSPEYSQQWRRDAMGDEGHGEGWKKAAKPPPADPDADDDAPRPEEGMEEATPEEIAERERWYKNAKAPERTFQDPKNEEWWKQPQFIEAFQEGGDGCFRTDQGSPDECTPEEKAEREQWYKDNWWKAKKYKDDWKKNGPSGKLWKSPNQKEAESGSPSKSVGPEEARRREDWYKEKAPDEEWWKAPEFVQDYHQNGDDGRHWAAKTQAAGVAGRAQEEPANADEQKKREEWYKDNWWKQSKYVEDFCKNPNAAAAPGCTAWTAKSDDSGKDKEWWKQPPFIADWSEAMAPKSRPQGADWWQQPEYIEDFQRNGDKGEAWPAAKESAAVARKAQETPASDDEKQKRADWYKQNWWKSPVYAQDWALKGPRGERWQAGSPEAANDPAKGASAEPISPDERREREAYFRPQGDMWRAVGEPEGFDKKAKEYPCDPVEALKRDAWYRKNWWKAPEYIEDWEQNGPKGTKWLAGSEDSARAGEGQKDPATDEERRARDNWYKNQGDIDWWKEPQFVEDWNRNGDKGQMWPADTRNNAQKFGGDEHPADPEEKKKREDWYKKNWWKTPAAVADWKKHGKDGAHWTRQAPPARDERDPETEGENWWKQPAYIEDWLKAGPDGKCWTAEDPLSGATAQGHKKPASDPEKEKRAQWYKDNWWKAPSCADDWAKNGAKGAAWTGKDPEATKAGTGDKDPAPAEALKQREDWYKKRGDKDDWWKRPEFCEDFHENGDKGKMWIAANPTAGALGQGKECPAAGPEKEKRAEWYKDNWWKQPKYAAAWKKGEDAWAKETPGAMKECVGPEKKKREDWFRANTGEPVSDDEKAAREDWFKKHAGEPSGPQLQKREDWFKKQLNDADRKKRMDWLKERAPNDKRILMDELPEALAVINEGQKPTEAQIQAVVDHVKKNREAQRDDWGRDAEAKPEEEDETIGQDEFLQAVADTNFYVAPDKEELEMQAEEAKEEQEMQEMARQEEEAAFLAMEKEEELKNTPEQWQRRAKGDVGAKEDWWKQPEFIENYQKNPDAQADTAHWAKDPRTKEPVSPEEQEAREAWYKDNWWKSPEYSQQWRRDAMGDEGHGEGWKKAAKPPPADPDADDDAPRPEEGMEEATPEEIAERERWYKNAKAPERTFQDPKNEEWWKQPQFIEAFQEGGDGCFRTDQGSPDECTPEEKAEREQWYKDNWWKVQEGAQARG